MQNFLWLWNFIEVTVKASALFYFFKITDFFEIFFREKYLQIPFILFYSCLHTSHGKLLFANGASAFSPASIIGKHCTVCIDFKICIHTFIWKHLVFFRESKKNFHCTICINRIIVPAIPSERIFLFANHFHKQSFPFHISHPSVDKWALFAVPHILINKELFTMFNLLFSFYFFHMIL